MAKTQIAEILGQFGREKRAHYSLENLRRALSQAGDPQKSVYSLIIGGTNGKGSVSLLLSAGLKEAGFKVETYLSPHLVSPTERFLEDLSPIAEDDLLRWMQMCLPAAKQFDLTYFEFLTYIAFLKARETRPDFLVLEVGLGGRLDATNLCDPIASVLTSIGLDHQDILGPDEQSILREKLEIVRPEGLLFTGVQEPALVEQIEKHCLDIDAIPYYSRELRARCLERGFWGQKASINGFPFELTCPTEKALENAKTALLALRILFPRIDVDVFRRGFRKVLLPARFETLQQRPRVLLSGDHNVPAVLCLMETLNSLSTIPGCEPQGGRLATLAAFSPDKDFQTMIPLLQQVSDQLVVTYIPDGQDRMPQAYGQFLPDDRDPKILIEELMRDLSEEDTLLITGSLYLAGAVRPLWSKDVRFLATDAEVERRFGLEAGGASLATVPQAAKERKHVVLTEGVEPPLLRTPKPHSQTQLNPNQ